MVSETFGLARLAKTWTKNSRPQTARAVNRARFARADADASHYRKPYSAAEALTRFARSPFIRQEPLPHYNRTATAGGGVKNSNWWQKPIQKSAAAASTAGCETRPNAGINNTVTTAAATTAV
jgi:hypothetical protein